MFFYKDGFGIKQRNQTKVKQTRHIKYIRQHNNIGSITFRMNLLWVHNVDTCPSHWERERERERGKTFCMGNWESSIEPYPGLHPDPNPHPNPDPWSCAAKRFHL